MKRWMLALFALLGACAGPRASLRAQLETLHQDPAMHRAIIAAEVRDLRSGELIFARHPHKRLVPASTIKLLTAATALHHLGAEHSYVTRLVSSATVAAGVLKGDLVIVGGGDPSLGEEAPQKLLKRWSQSILQRGISRIEGSIVADVSAYQGERLGAGWAWDDAPYGYSSVLSALSFDKNTTRLTVEPAGAGAPGQAKVRAKVGLPACVELKVLAKTSSVAGKLRLVRDGERTVIKGSMQEGAPPWARTLTIPNPGLCTARRLLAQLREDGVVVSGEAKVRAGSAEPGWRVLEQTRSPPLKALLTKLLKESRNLYAELIAASLSPQAPRFSEALPALESTLEAAGVSQGSYRIADASGLSRYDQLTARALVFLLSWSWRQPWAAELLSMLPIAGEDGTLASRMRAGPAQGRVIAKTGSMSGVSAIAGYVIGKSGAAWAFAILVNGADQPGRYVRALQDRMLELMAGAQAEEDR